MRRGWMEVPLDLLKPRLPHRFAGGVTGVDTVVSPVVLHCRRVVDAHVDGDTKPAPHLT